MNILTDPITLVLIASLSGLIGARIHEFYTKRVEDNSKLLKDLTELINESRDKLEFTLNKLEVIELDAKLVHAREELRLLLEKREEKSKLFKNLKSEVYEYTKSKNGSCPLCEQARNKKIDKQEEQIEKEEIEENVWNNR